MYERILAAAIASPWMMEPNMGEIVAGILTRRINGELMDPVVISAAVAAKRPQSRSRSPGVALVPVHGVMMQRASMFDDMSGLTSTEVIGNQIDQAVADPSVDTIVMDIDSPGGSVFGVDELATKISNATKTKKVIAVANSQAGSGAYYIGSQASEFVVTPSGAVGSIGVYVMHVDRSEEMKARGRKVSYISAGEHKLAGNEHSPLGAEAAAVIQSSVDAWYSQFVKAVARGRDVSQTKVRDGFGKGSMVHSEAAVKEGMADRTGTLEEVLARFGVSLADVTPVQQTPELEPRSKASRGVDVRRRRMLMD